MESESKFADALSMIFRAIPVKQQQPAPTAIILLMERTLPLFQMVIQLVYSRFIKVQQNGMT